MGKAINYLTKEFLLQKIGMNAKNLSKELGIHYDTLINYINKYDLKDQFYHLRKYQINDNFFSCIDTEERAYWLGFLMADGCVYNKNNTIGLDLNKIDESHLYKFLYHINSNYPIKYKKRDKKANEKTIVTCRIISKKMKLDLINLNCGPNKTFSLKWPINILDQYIRHMIRGYFDGDGCLAKHIKGFWQCSIIGTLNFIENLKSYLSSINILSNNLQQVKSCPLMHIFSITNNSKLYPFLEYLYKDANVYLDRKFMKYQQFLEEYRASYIQ